MPVNMAYNLTLLDRGGSSATVYVCPDVAPEVTDLAVATNHRGTLPDFPEHARRFRSVERQQALLKLLARDPRPEQLRAAFLRDPLYNTDYGNGFGTIYTAVYRPEQTYVEYVWPGSSWLRDFESADATHVAVLGTAAMPPAHVA
jgi:predicted choloylglycine hydrolase